MIFNKAIRHVTNEVVEKMYFDDATNWKSGITIGTTQSGAMKLSAVNACVEVLSNSISKIPIYISNTKKNTIEDDHPLKKVLCVRPNEAMTPATYKKLLKKYELMNGNAYSIIVRDRKTAQPVELIPINPRFMRPEINGQGEFYYVFTNPRTGEAQKVSNFNVIHYKAFSDDGINGISVLSRAAEVINTAKATQKYENKLYTQNAKPSGVLKAPTELTKEAKDKVREEWDGIYGGVGNAFRTAILDIGLEYQQISLSNKDTQFVESKEISVIDIARFFGVPPYKIYAGNQSYNSNEQNSLEYVSTTLQPYITQYEEEDSYKLLFDAEADEGLKVKRNMMAELRGDTSSRGAWYKIMRELGVYSVNDVLAKEDMPSVPGGDTRYASLNYIPLELFKELSEKRNGGDR